MADVESQGRTEASQKDFRPLMMQKNILNIFQRPGIDRAAMETSQSHIGRIMTTRPGMHFRSHCHAAACRPTHRPYANICSVSDPAQAIASVDWNRMGRSRKKKQTDTIILRSAPYETRHPFVGLRQRVNFRC